MNKTFGEVFEKDQLYSYEYAFRGKSGFTMVTKPATSLKFKHLKKQSPSLDMVYFIRVNAVGKIVFMVVSTYELENPNKTVVECFESFSRMQKNKIQSATLTKK